MSTGSVENVMQMSCSGAIGCVISHSMQNNRPFISYVSSPNTKWGYISKDDSTLRNAYQNAVAELGEQNPNTLPSYEVWAGKVYDLIHHFHYSDKPDAVAEVGKLALHICGVAAHSSWADATLKPKKQKTPPAEGRSFS